MCCVVLFEVMPEMLHNMEKMRQKFLWKVLEEARAWPPLFLLSLLAQVVVGCLA